MESHNIKFEADGKSVEFNVKHNLADYGLQIENALWSWVFRTLDYSCKSFCEYVRSKDPNIKCYEDHDH